MGNKKESKIQTEIINYLDTIGVYSVKTIACNRKGVSDILACYKGVFVAIEVKNQKGVISPLQKIELQKVRNAGGYAIVAYCLEDVRNLIKEIECFN